MAGMCWNWKEDGRNEWRARRFKDMGGRQEEHGCDLAGNGHLEGNKARSALLMGLTGCAASIASSNSDGMEGGEWIARC